MKSSGVKKKSVYEEEDYRPDLKSEICHTYKIYLFNYMYKTCNVGNSLAMQCLGLCASAAGGMGLVPGQGTKIPHAVQPKKKKQKKHVML